MRYTNMSTLQTAKAYYLNLCDIAVMALMLLCGFGALVVYLVLLSSPVWVTIFVLYQLLLGW